MKTIIFSTTNDDKTREVCQMLEGLDIEVRAEALELPEIQGEPDDVVGAKLDAAFDKLNCPVIVEDTSLMIDAFGGFPGAYIKDFMDKLGREKVAGLVSLAGRKGATAQCIFGYKDEKCRELFKGKVKGQIVKPKGDSGFGWDPIFRPLGHDKTFAEMEAKEKNAISHRKLALEKLAGFLKKSI